MYNFDEIIDRTKTNDLKWNSEITKAMIGCHLEDDTIPMWIADMDFKCPPCILERLKERLEQGILGYCSPRGKYYEAIMTWLKKRHDWEVKKEWIVTSPGIVPALNVAIRAFTNYGDKVLIQQPVYDPFKETIRKTGRIPVNNPLILHKNGTYEMDYKGLENLLSKEKIKLMILCSPHNPVGRVWKQEELQKLGEICKKYGVFIISDEIHSDMVYHQYKHIPICKVNETLEQCTMVCTAPSKTFNVAGLKCSNIIIPNIEYREKFVKTRDEMGLNINSTMAIEVVPAAYCKEGEIWLDEVIGYIEENVKMVQSFLKERLPMITMTKPEGTFLLWLDFSKVSEDENEILKLLNDKAKVAVVPGSWFGEEGRNYIRFNIAYPRSILEKALLNIEQAIKQNRNQ